METRANFVLIGSFTLAVIAAAFGFVLWFQSLHTTKARSPLRIVFEGPAAEHLPEQIGAASASRHGERQRRTQMTQMCTDCAE